MQIHPVQYECWITLTMSSTYQTEIKGKVYLESLMMRILSIQLIIQFVESTMLKSMMLLLRSNAHNHPLTPIQQTINPQFILLFFLTILVLEWHLRTFSTRMNPIGTLQRSRDSHLETTMRLENIKKYFWKKYLFLKKIKIALWA